MESFFGNSPWDFGTGFGAFNTNPQSFQPMAPPVDLPQQMASTLAMQGIRPQQFFSNPAAAVQALQPPQPAASAWDETPVDMPGGKPVRLPGQPQTQLPLPTGGGNPNTQDGAASDAQAGGTAEEAAAGKKGSIADRLTETLKGVKMPASPALQSIRTPAVPPPTAIKGGELLALLMAMQPQGAQPGLKLPPTLGASLQGAFR
jgi:hypothetical protein